MDSTRLRRPRRASRLVPALLLTLGGALWLPSAHAANVIRYVLPVIVPRQLPAYDIYLDSSTEFPMRDEVIYLSIGGKQFMDSHYVQGGTLHTIVFRLSQSQYQALQDGAPTVVYYSQGDAVLPASQWNFGKFHKAAVALPILPTPILPVKPTPILPVKTLGTISTAQKGQK